ncbi:hypothetical protein [Chitinophaga japonensis]|uniref:Lipoprotein n=1 Tax=Chitinophaga japonensis TaxID=104662 RepID=A0A562SHR5_CHIJA|nr:hypothetical protein [Chitinophaga japonensis]TWI80855.1 hypothetical protein LX66_5460 [Chitinophaga japonensis]
MKVLITLIMFFIALGCVQSGKDAKVATSSDTKVEDSIVDPIAPSHFEIDYNRIVKLGTDFFPEGSTGIGSLRIYIDTASRIERFEIVFARIENKGNIIYNYLSDKDDPKTEQLINAFKGVVNGIKVKKLGNPKLHGLEAYDLAIKFE